MKPNESLLDRSLRAVLGILLIAAWAFGFIQGIWAILLGLLGGVLLVTAIVGFCPLYALLGIRTCSVSKT